MKRRHCSTKAQHEAHEWESTFFGPNRGRNIFRIRLWCPGTKENNNDASLP